jgi:hypothetical protein
MSWKDKRKETFTSNTERPSLGEKRVQIKEHDGDVCFLMYKKNEDGGGENINLGKELKGLLLGIATSYEAFDDKFGKNGGSWRTGYIFDKGNTAVFDPTGKFLMSADRETCKKFINAETGERPRFLTVYFLLTTDGIYAVYSNGTIGLDQQKRYKNSLMYNYAILNTEVYSKDSDVTKEADEMLGKFRFKNPPKFANLKVGDPIDDDFAEEAGVDDAMDLFDHYKKYYVNVKESSDNTDELPSGLSVQETEDIAQKVDNYNKGAGTRPIKEDEDLPF